MSDSIASFHARRLAESLSLNSGFTVHNIVTGDPKLAPRLVVAALREWSEAESIDVNLRWFLTKDLDRVIPTLERLLFSTPSDERQLLVVVLSELDPTQVDIGHDLFAKLNSRRDVMHRELRGELILCTPDWLEPQLSSAAPDLASFVKTTYVKAAAIERTSLEEWMSSCDDAFEARCETGDAHQHYEHGTYTVAYGFAPGAVQLSNAALLERLAKVRGYTGWRPWHLSDKFAPSLGRLFSSSLPIWRIAEALLHARDLGEALGLPISTPVRFSARWTGLDGRELSNWPDAIPHHTDKVSVTPSVSTSTVFDLDESDVDLAAIVTRLLAPLYECFDFFEPSTDFVAHQLERLRRG